VDTVIEVEGLRKVPPSCSQPPACSEPAT
jgi:hypothetical protein